MLSYLPQHDMWIFWMRKKMSIQFKECFLSHNVLLAVGALMWLQQGSSISIWDIESHKNYSFLTNEKKVENLQNCNFSEAHQRGEVTRQRMTNFSKERWDTPTVQPQGMGKPGKKRKLEFCKFSKIACVLTWWFRITGDPRYEKDPQHLMSHSSVLMKKTKGREEWKRWYKCQEVNGCHSGQQKCPSTSPETISYVKLWGMGAGTPLVPWLNQRSNAL